MRIYACGGGEDFNSRFMTGTKGFPQSNGAWTDGSGATNNFSDYKYVKLVITHIDTGTKIQVKNLNFQCMGVMSVADINTSINNISGDSENDVPYAGLRYTYGVGMCRHPQVNMGTCSTEWIGVMAIICTVSLLTMEKS